MNLLIFRKREPTPLEEMRRSWNKKPDYLSIALNKAVLDKYVDPDGDEAETKARIVERCARRKAMKLAKSGK